MSRLIVSCLLLALAGSNASAQEVTVTPSGEYFMRFRHFEGKDYTPGGVTNFVRHRARMGMRLAYGNEISAFLQMQDVRTWGEEASTVDFDAEGVDLHQGYLDLMLFDEDVKLRVGRQEIGYLNHRLIGTANFLEQGRAFDAVRLMAMAMDRELALDFFYARMAHAILPPNTAVTDDIFGFAAKMQVGDFFQPALISILDLGSGVDRVRSTTGVVLALEYPFGLKASLEGYIQAGSSEPSVSIFGWMAAARVRFTLVDVPFMPFAELFGQFLSGDDDPADSDVKAFDPLFGTHHKFYGEADLFTNIPVDTGGRGLADFGTILGSNMFDILTFQVALHVMQTMESRDGPSLYAVEIDTTFGLKPNSYLSFDLNYSAILPGEALTAAEDPLVEHFFYFTLGAAF